MNKGDGIDGMMRDSKSITAWFQGSMDGGLRICIRAVIVATVLAFWGCSPAEDPATRLERALQLESDGDLRTAAFELRRALQDAPDHGDLRFHHGRMNVIAGRGEAAQRELRRALELGVPAEQVMFWLVDALLLQERFTAALTEISSLTSGEEALDTAWLVRRGEAHLGLGRMEEAAADLRQALELDSEQARALTGLAHLAQRRRDDAGALELARRAARADPHDAKASLMHGWMALRLARFEEAEQALLAAAQSARARANPQDLARARLHLVEVYLGQEKMAEAEAAVASLEELTGDVPEISYLKAVVAYRQADYAAAQGWLQDTLLQRPDHQSARLLAGAVAYARDDFEEAGRQLRRYLAVVPDNAIARRLLAATEARLGRHEEAMAVLAPLRARGQGPDTAGLLALIGRAASMAGQYATAERALQSALAESPDDPAVRADLARLRAAQGRYDEAIGQLTELIREGDDSADVLLVQTLMAMGDLEQARRHAGSLVERDPARAEWHTLAALIDLNRGERQQAREGLDGALAVDEVYLPALLTLGRLDLEDGDPAAAERHFNAVLAVQPDHALAMRGLADVAHQRGDAATARAWLERAVNAHPDVIQPRLWLARFDWQAGDADAAIAAARGAVERVPGDPRARHLLGELQARSGDLEGASATYGRLLERLPTDLTAMLMLARIQGQLERPDEARRHMTAALELAPRDLRVLEQAAQLELALGQREAALEAARRAQVYHPDSAVGWVVEGDVHASAGRHAQAREAYVRAHELAPSSLNARRVAQMAQRSGSADEAMRVLEEWLKVDTEDAQAMLNLAILYQEHGRAEQGEALYGEVLSRHPDHAVALNNLAWIYLARNDPRALETARRAHELQPAPAMTHTYGWTLVEHGDVSTGLGLIESAAREAPLPEVRYHLAVALSRSGDDARARQVLSELLKEPEQFRQRAEAEALYQRLR
jgi:cellulose synthase operon protein C